jgi:membrane protease YdiL (CAAX protease family)
MCGKLTPSPTLLDEDPTILNSNAPSPSDLPNNPEEQTPSTPEPSCGGLWVWFMMVGPLVIVVALLVLPGLSRKHATWAMALGSVGVELAVLTLPLIVLRLGGFDLRRVLSLNRPANAVWWYVVLAILGGSLLSMEVSSWQEHFFPASTDVAKRLEELLEFLDKLPMVVAVLLVGVLPGICEEVLCRGFLLGLVRPRWGATWAVVISAVAFALFHLEPHKLVAMTLIGILLGYIVVWSGSLYPAMFAHALNNTFIILIEKNSATIERASWLDSSSWTPLPWYVLVVAVALLVTGLCLLKRGNVRAAPSDHMTQT